MYLYTSEARPAHDSEMVLAIWYSGTGISILSIVNCPSVSLRQAIYSPPLVWLICAGKLLVFPIFCYLLVVVLFAAVNIAFGLDFTTGVTASVACIGNVGPGFGTVGSMANYASFPVILKASSMLEMLVGRLEIFPILYLFQSVRDR